jgi:uncharacterized protein (DUF1810 family)
MEHETDIFDLKRFLEPQARDFDRACEELRAGRKRTHWIWYVFPQLRGLAKSARAYNYGITSLDEARAYLSHPILGPRLKQSTELVLTLEGRSLSEIFSPPDDVKFCSSMTLFAKAADAETLFERALSAMCGGNHDPLTLVLLQADGAISELDSCA